MITITALGRGSDLAPSPSSSTHTQSSPPPALCYLIRIDNSYLLLDCGAPEDLCFPVVGDSVKRTLAEYTTEEGEIDAEALSHIPLDEAIAIVAPRISLVLLSHSTIRHVGLYAYARARLGLTCPAYASLPTGAMGRLVTLEASMAISAECDVSLVDKRPIKVKQPAQVQGSKSAVKKEEEEDMQEDEVAAPTRDRCVPTRIEVDEAFENLRTLRYLQPTVLDGQMSSLSLTAHSAGHTLGGTVWKVRSPTSGTVVLAIDWNHVKERHIDGSGVIEGASASGSSTRRGEEAAGTKRAEMLVTSGAGIGKVNARRKDKDKKLLDLVHDTLTNVKSTLHLPLDASPRLLEVLLLLDQHWAYSYPHARFPLCLVSKTGKEVIERARTMREWMGRNLQGEEGAGASDNTKNGRRRGGGNEGQGHGPLEFRFLRIFTSLQALSAAVPPDSAKVVITVGPSLLYGPSLRFFREHVSQDSRHVVVFTQKCELGSVASTLRSWWLDGQGKGWDGKTVGREVDGNGRQIGDVVVREQVPLQGAELEEHLAAERVKKEREEQHKALVARSRRRLEADEEDEDESDEDDDSEDDSESDEDDAGLAAVVEGIDAPTRRRGKKRARGDDTAGGVEDGNEAGMHATGEGEFTMLGSTLSHDNYLRGNASRQTNFFGSTGGNTKHPHQATDSERATEARERHGVGVRFRTFPVIEKRKRVDAFGEVIDVGRWLSRGRREKQEEEERVKREAEGSAMVPKRRKMGDDDGEDDDDALVLPPGSSSRDLIDTDDEYGGVPTKFTSSTTSLRVSCRIAVIDLEGLIDGRALSIVLPQLAPRRLVLVDTPQPVRAGVDVSKMKTQTAQFITSLLAVRDFTHDIYAPAIGQRVSVGAQVKAFDVKLGEGLLEGVRMGLWEEWSLGWIAGRVAGGVGTTEEEREETPRGYALPAAISLDRILGGMQTQAQTTGEPADTEGEETRATYLPTTSTSSSTSTVNPTFFIGDVRLSKLKSTLSSQHRIPSEFGGSGTLVCGSAALAQAGISVDMTQANTANQASAAVTVRKGADGRILVEGNAGRTFVRVREAVYAMHARIGEA